MSTACFPIYDLSTRDRIERSYEALAQAVDAGADDVEVLRAAHNRLVSDAEESAEHVIYGAAPRSVRRNLVDAYPPREGNTDDVMAGFDQSREDDFMDDLLYAVIVEPKFSTRRAFDEWVENLSQGDYKALSFEVYRHSFSAVVDPKSLRVLQPIPKNDPSSDSPEPSGARLGD